MVPCICANMRLDILSALWDEYRDRVRLADDLECSVELVHRWLVEGEPPGDDDMGRVLSLALQRSSKAWDLLRAEVLEPVESVFDSAGPVCRTKPGLGFGDILDLLDDKSRCILWYLWWNRHASVSELAKVAGFRFDTDVLLRMNGVINLTSREVAGRDIVTFQESRVDPVTGEKVLFSWWLDDESASGLRTPPPVDLFDEDGHIVVIVQLPAPVHLGKGVELHSNDGVLRITIPKAAEGGSA